VSRPGIWSLVLIAAISFGCTKLNPGRCDQQSDCTTGTCNLSTKVCELGGGGGGSGGAGGLGGAKTGTGGKPFSCADTLCPAATPICDMAAGKCKACYEEGSTACKDLDIAAPLCVSNTDAAGGPLKGSCVGCLTNANCTGTPKTPICSPTSNTCVSCGPDSDCAGVGPGVCLTDGHCATESETIFVQNDSASCSEAPAASDGGATVGTRAHPFCTMQPVKGALSSTRDLVVVTGTVSGAAWTYANDVGGDLSIVGQGGAATISGAASPAFATQSGGGYIRSVTFSPSASIGIKATGGFLSLERVTVDSCKGGGILLDGASFHIENTTVSNNGPGQQGTSSWGGILVNTLPTTGSAVLDFVTIKDNKQVGLACINKIVGTNVFASGNLGDIDIQTLCNVTGCTPASSACGAQP
jgi:hypothetical protein